MNARDVYSVNIILIKSNVLIKPNLNYTQFYIFKYTPDFTTHC